MGLLYRCTSCDKEMVLESFHRGRTVPCPWCQAESTVPESLDFETVYRARATDESRGRWHLSLAVAAAVTCCLPLAAAIWWLSNGAVQRAREDQREADPLLLNARVISGVAATLHGIVWVIAAVQEFAP